MPETNDQDINGGVDKLVALANVAAMSDAELDAASSGSPPPTAAADASDAAWRETVAHTSSSSRPARPPQSSVHSSSRGPAKKRAVPPEFDDAAASSIGDDEPIPTSTANPPKNQRRRTLSLPSTFRMKSNQPSFPVILMGIMSAPQNKEFISFLPDEQGFVIIDPMVFARNILPMHFEENVPTFDQFLHLLSIWYVCDV